MQSFKLPSVLSTLNTANSISMERALKQAKELLDLIPESSAEIEDKISATVSDLDTMLAAIER